MAGVDFPLQAKTANAENRGFSAEQMPVELGMHRRCGKSRRADRHERAFHAAMRMGVDDAGNHDLPGSIDDVIVRWTGASPDLTHTTAPVPAAAPRLNPP